MYQVYATFHKDANRQPVRKGFNNVAIACEEYDRLKYNIDTEYVEIRDGNGIFEFYEG